MGAPQQELMSYSSGSSPDIADYFSAYTYTGNGSTQTITNGIDLSTKGGLVWGKGRNGAYDHGLFDTINGTGKNLFTNQTAGLYVDATSLTSFNSTGYTAGSDAINGTLNSAGATYVSWSFAQGPKFFKVAQVVVSGSDQTVDLSSLGTVGMVTVKRTDATSDWYTWHKDLSAGNLMYLNTSAAQASLGYITVSGTTLTLVQSVIGNGTYIVYAWAHDSSAGGMIQCGTFTDSGGTGASVTLGFEPQLVIWKRQDGLADWNIADASRQMALTNALWLHPNTSGAEVGPATTIWPTATGFVMGAGALITNAQYIYLAIRRGPMKKPTVGTQVYNAIARTGTGAAEKITGVGFPPDLAFVKKRSSSTLTGATWLDRLRGATQVLVSSGNTTEVAQTQSITSFDMDGVTTGTTYTNINANTQTYINWYLRRYPKVFDEVCYTGTGSVATITHNLNAIPEIIFIKERDSSGIWTAYYGDNTSYLIPSSNVASTTIATAWNNTSPTASVFTVGTLTGVNFVGGTYVAYLFATLAGISKVGSYTGNGSSQTINCGFTTGARFILIKRTDSTGDWFVWDTTRGIVSGNDGHLSLNTTAAEVTTDDSIDPDNSGFIVNQVAATNVNVTSAIYIFCSFA